LGNAGTIIASGVGLVLVPDGLAVGFIAFGSTGYLDVDEEGVRNVEIRAGKDAGRAKEDEVEMI
jgi:hypothetical protein